MPKKESNAAIAAETGFYTILIRDLVLVANIGVYAHEKRGPQRVGINVSLKVKAPPAPFPDSLSAVLSYEDIVEGMRKMVVSGHINLIETLAERVATLCLADERAIEATVRVEKLDVYAQAAGIGIEITRFQGGAANNP